MTPADIIAFRELYALTRADFAKLMHVSRRAVDYWEEGRTKITEQRAEQFRELEQRYGAEKKTHAEDSVTSDWDTETVTPEEIMEIRRARGWSRAQLASAVGASGSAVDYWQRGVHPPSGIFKKRLKKLLVKPGVVQQANAVESEATTLPTKTAELFEAAAAFRDYRRKSMLRDGLDFAKAKGSTFENKVELFLAIVLDQAPTTTVKELLETIKS